MTEQNQPAEETYEEPGAYEQDGGQDNAQPLDHRALDDQVSEGKKASEDLHEGEDTPAQGPDQ